MSSRIGRKPSERLLHRLVAHQRAVPLHPLAVVAVLGVHPLQVRGQGSDLRGAAPRSRGRLGVRLGGAELRLDGLLVECLGEQRVGQLASSLLPVGSTTSPSIDLALRITSASGAVASGLRPHAASASRRPAAPPRPRRQPASWRRLGPAGPGRPGPGGCSPRARRLTPGSGVTSAQPPRRRSRRRSRRRPRSPRARLVAVGVAGRRRSAGPARTSPRRAPARRSRPSPKRS